MCYHRLIIYATCGHASYSAHPLLLCSNASIPPTQTRSTACKITPHPFKALKLERLCPACQQRRDVLVGMLEQDLVIKFDEWRWKVSYGTQTHREEAWQKLERDQEIAEERTKRAEEKTNRAEEGTEKADERQAIPEESEPSAGSQKTGKSTSNRFSWLRSKTRSENTKFSGLNLLIITASTGASLATMPTPESASFKASKPTVPPTFDGVDYDDNKALKAAQDSIIREQWVQSMMARLIRDEMGKCYHREGVNHLEKCGKLRERYLQQLKHAKVKGYLFEQQNYLPKS